MGSRSGLRIQRGVWSHLGWSVGMFSANSSSQIYEISETWLNLDEDLRVTS